MTRDARHHVAFGFGVHQCLGQPLARVELQVVYGTLYRRIPNLRLAAPLESIPFKHDGSVYGSTNYPSRGDRARRRSGMKILIDQDKCIASGQCVMAAPDVFDQRDEDGVVVLVDPDPPAGLAADVRQAAAVCPALAITVEQ